MTPWDAQSSGLDSLLRWFQVPFEVREWICETQCETSKSNFNGSEEIQLKVICKSDPNIYISVSRTGRN